LPALRLLRKRSQPGRTRQRIPHKSGESAFRQSSFVIRNLVFGIL
jgi:hypothetical protein